LNPVAEALFAGKVVHGGPIAITAGTSLYNLLPEKVSEQFWE